MKFQEHNRRVCRDGAVHVFSVAYAAVEAFIQADDDLVALELEVLERCLGDVSVAEIAAEIASEADEDEEAMLEAVEARMRHLYELRLVSMG